MASVGGGGSQGLVDLSGYDEYQREQELEAMEQDSTSSQSQGTPPLIRVRQMQDLLTPSNSPPVTPRLLLSASASSSTPKSQGNGNGNHTIPSMYSNSQKRKAPVKVKGSPVKAARPSSKQKTVSGSTTSINLTPSTSTKGSKSKPKISRYVKPTAKNSGMPHNALLKYFPDVKRVATPEVDKPKDDLPLVPEDEPGEEDQAQIGQVNSPPPPAEEDDDVVIIEEVNEVIAGEVEVFDENEVHVPPLPASPPPGFPQLMYRTPPKSLHEMAQGVSSITIVPRPHAPPKVKSVSKPDRTPPHDEPELPPPEAVRRQLFPGKARIPPKQKNPEETRARVEAYRRWQYESGSEEEDEDSAKENEASSSPASPTGDSNSATDEDGDKKRRRRRGRPAGSRPKPTLQRRSSNNSSSDGAGSGCGKRKLADLAFGIPLPLAKALRKYFGDDVNSGRMQDGNVGLVDIDPTHLAYLLERCNWFVNMDTTTPALFGKIEQQETLELFVKGIKSALELSGGDALQDRAKTVPHLLNTLQVLYQNSGRPNPMNCYWEIFMDVFKRPEQARRRSKEEEPLKLLDWIVKLMQVTYQEYMDTIVKIHFPFVASLLQGPPTTNLNHKWNVIKNFRELVSLIFSFEESTKESSILVAVFNLAVDFYDRRRVQFYGRDEEILDSLWEGIKQRQDENVGAMDWGLSLIKRIQRKSFGTNICKRILVENLDELEDSELNQGQIDLILKDIVQSSLVLQRVREDYDHGRRQDRHDDNLKGETSFHRACALRPTDKMSKKVKGERSKEKLDQLLLELFCQSSTGDINAVDNNGNTPLADACQSGRLDAIEAIFQKCWKPKEPASRQNLDILAVDAHQNTLLHIALSSLKVMILGGADADVLEEKVKVVKFLLEKAGESPKKLQILLGSRNNMDETIFSFGVDGNPVSDECELLLRANWNATMQPFMTSSTIQLTQESIKKIQDSRALQTILAYWEHFTSGGNL